MLYYETQATYLPRLQCWHRCQILEDSMSPPAELAEKQAATDQMNTPSSLNLIQWQYTFAEVRFVAIRMDKKNSEFVIQQMHSRRQLEWRVRWSH